MSLQFIMNNNPQICETGAFLDSLVEMEHVDHDEHEQITSSPVFNVTQDPFTIYNCYYHFIMNYKDPLMEFPGKTEYTTYRSSNQMKFKNQNKNFRKRGFLKQPGGASCDQRR